MLIQKDIARLYADKHDVSVSEASEIINSVIELFKEAILYHGGFVISNFGTFKISHRKARAGCDPRRPQETKGQYIIQPHDYPLFHPSKNLVNELNHRETKTKK